MLIGTGVSILGLVPLVKLHDLCTRDLAIRIGGSKTGLLNASLSNLVEIVVAISALRRCELRVVQSSLVGSVLSKLLLVLGLCFFAGGMRFSEQGFDATATQMHCSLMSISVGAILLPAAYHFTLEDRRGDKDTPVPQGRNILHMSHGIIQVSIVLLFIYSAYLLFQLWSHKHLYHDKHNKKSQRLPVQVRVVPKTANVFKNAGKKIATSFSTLDLSKPVQSPYPETCIALEPRSHAQTHFSPYGSQLTLNELPEAAGVDRHTLVDYPGASTVRPASSPDDATLTREQSRLSDRSSSSIAPTATMSFEDLGDESRVDDDQCNPLKEPHLSWTVTLTLMVIVTIVSIPKHSNARTNPSVLEVVAITAESLVESMDGISTAISKEWIGLIVLPSVSAVAECITAVNVSVRDELTLSVSVAVGSSIVSGKAIFMVILAWITHKPLSLLLDPFQSLVLYLSVQIMNYVVADGKSNWLEGVILICLYVIVAVSFWFYPGKPHRRISLISQLYAFSDPMECRLKLACRPRTLRCSRPDLNGVDGLAQSLYFYCFSCSIDYLSNLQIDF
ncbi:Vacuolar calcium ion transporter [Leucoagaricus sp. SymC.cos]|nr:Vacuolar calcium ion transporter [Leucoagaricus sp. SymC.cos]